MPPISNVRPRPNPKEFAVQITAVVTNSTAGHQVQVRTGAASQSLSVSPKTVGKGSAINGGEFLMLALATCYCNDLYREAERLGVSIEGVEVEATAEFPGVGLAATNIKYKASVSSSASGTAVAQLLRETDAVAEIHNTIRTGVPVELVQQ
jgi:organic hydroperoxide reductase OsmC/OhrA